MPAPKHMRQLTTWQVLCQVERRFHTRELNHQPLPWDLGVSPPSSNSLGSSRTNLVVSWGSKVGGFGSSMLGLANTSGTWDQFSRLKSSMPFERDLALQKNPLKTQPQIQNEGVTWSPQHNMPATRTNKCRALSRQEVELDGWFLIFHIVQETCTV